jgi:hypothetical protein
MKSIAVFLVMLALSACSGASAKQFFGTDDPCQIIEGVHSGFNIVASTSPQVAQYRDEERVFYVAAKEQCSDGDLTKTTMFEVINSYSAAVAEWKSGKTQE